jgi:transcriptional regulator GlxA family with amidase domain
MRMLGLAGQMAEGDHRGEPLGPAPPLRLERAAQLLEAGAGSLYEITSGVGFERAAHVSTRFQEHSGVEPSAYRLPVER